MEGKTLDFAPNYIIYSNGTVKNKHTNKFLKGQVGKNGYRSMILTTIKGKKRVYVHRLVGEAFLENLENKEQVNHINGVKTDNMVSNLEWCTPQENLRHAVKELGFKPPEFSKEARAKGKKLASTKVFKYDLKGNLLCVYDSILDASKAEHISRHSIRDVLKGKKGNHKGFVWRYN